MYYRSKFFIFKLTLLLLAGGIFSSPSFAQDPEEEQSFYNKPIEVRKLNEDKWKSLKKDLDYSPSKKLPKKTEEPPKEYQEEKTSSGSFSLAFPGLKYVLFSIAIIILIVVLLKLLGVNILASNKSVSSGKEITIENMDEEIHESDLERFLRESLTRKEYKLAIRIYYLIILRELSLKNWIHWKKDKTNREYLSEMRQRESYPPFLEITRIFEKVWYGEKEIQEPEYTQLSPAFKNFVEGLKKKEGA